MTGRTATIALLLAIVSSLLVLGGGALRLRAAAAGARGAEVVLEQVRRDAERVLDLRARLQTIGAGELPRQDVYRRVNEALAASGLAHVSVQSVSPAGDESLDPGGEGPGRRVQTVRIVLEPITLAELGAWLDHWRREQALWTITGIDLAAANPRSSAGNYRATLTGAAVYVPETRSGLDAAPNPTVSPPP